MFTVKMPSSHGILRVLLGVTRAGRHRVDEQEHKIISSLLSLASGIEVRPCLTDSLDTSSATSSPGRFEDTREPARWCLCTAVALKLLVDVVAEVITAPSCSQCFCCA